MKEEEVDLVDEGFEEVEKNANPGKEAPKAGGDAPRAGSNRPDLRVVQADRDRDGNVVYTNIGGMWKNVSKAGNEFYTLKIGNLKLLVFPNTNK